MALIKIQAGDRVVTDKGIMTVWGIGLYNTVLEASDKKRYLVKESEILFSVDRQESIFADEFIASLSYRGDIAETSNVA